MVIPDAKDVKEDAKHEQDPLGRALDEAISGRPKPLNDLLARGSHLPGTRMNAPLADAFAQLCRARGGRADAVALRMARLSPDEAPGATAQEFLPVCGVLALAARAASDAKDRKRFVPELHARADDLRFRVRDAVAVGLSRVGASAADDLTLEVEGWMDGYFHASAVVRAMANEPWLSSLHDAAGLVARFGDAFILLREAPRAAARWPGHKALLEALSASLPAAATRFGVPVFDMLVGWSEAKDPVLRDLVARAIASPKLASRFGAEVGRIRRALAATEPAPRNPDHDVGPTRDRSKNRRRR
jgi:hypothetical protein